MASLQRYAEQQLQKLFRSLDRALSTSEAESVHQTRVASRRLSVPLELCRPEAGDKYVERALKQIGGIRKSLRVVRELDVLQSSLTESSASPARDNLTPRDVEALCEELSCRRERARRKAQRKLAKVERKAIEETVNHIFDDLKSAEGYRPESIQNRLAELVTTQARQAIENGADYTGNADLHPTRLRLKQLRYGVELHLALTDENHDDLIGRFKAMQDLLGDWNDQLVAVDRLSKVARQRKIMMERPELAIHLLSHAAGRLERSRELADAFRAEWPAFRAVLLELVEMGKI